MGDCIKGFTEIVPSYFEEGSVSLRYVKNFQGHYLYPGLNFQCRVKIIRFRGLFVVRSPTSSTLSNFVQLWRNNSDQLSVALVVEFPLDFTADYSMCNGSQCIVDFELPPELQFVTEVGDYFGLYSIDAFNSRPVFHPMASEQSEFYEYQNDCNQRELSLQTMNKSIVLNASISPLLYFDFGMYLIHCCVYVVNIHLLNHF